MTIIAAADGSALGNPGPAGWAWYINDEQWLSGGWDKATNNQGELMAVLSLLIETRSAKDNSITILCDSQYVINAATTWLAGWKKKNWRKSDGKPVLNVELIKSIDREMQGREVNFKWVKGHSGHPLNEKADTLARENALNYASGSGSITGPGFSKAPSTEEYELQSSGRVQDTLF